MNKTNLGSMAATSLPEDILAYAAGYLELVIRHHDSLVARIRNHSAANLQAAVVASLQRQLRIQAATVESATEVVDELVLCERGGGAGIDHARLAGHQLQLLDEIRGFADRSVPV